MDLATAGIGLVLGGANMALGSARQSRQKSLMRKVGRIKDESLDKQYDLAKRKLAAEEAHAAKENIDAERMVNESAEERGVFDSSIRNDMQGERGYSHDRRMQALKFAREGLDNQYFTDKKLAKINTQISTATDYLGLIQQFINSGLGGVAQGMVKPAPGGNPVS